MVILWVWGEGREGSMPDQKGSVEWVPNFVIVGWV